MTRQTYTKPTLQPVANSAFTLGASRGYGNEGFREIEGFDAEELIAQYGSPLGIVSESALREGYRRMQEPFVERYPKTIVAWSVKTNYNTAVCAVFRDAGAWGEVVSGYEYGIARDIGIPGSQIIFNGPIKTDEEVLRAFAEGATINIDSFDELAQFEALAAQLDTPARVGIRVNMQLNYPPWSKFGFNLETGEAFQAARMVQSSSNLQLAGLHLHGGTYVTDLSIHARAAANLMDLALRLETELDASIEYIDLGGGYASENTLHGQFMTGEAVIPTPEQYAEAICTPVSRGAARLKSEPQLFIEPGRVMVDSSMTILTTVQTAKRLSNGKKAVIVDAGVNILPTAYWYKHETQLMRGSQEPMEEVNIYGGLCMNIDVLSTDVLMPPLRKGDRLAFHNCGAYNMTQSMQFIYPRPNYIMICEGRDGGPATLEVIRRKETPEDIRFLDRLPEVLHNDENQAALPFVTD